MKQKLINTGWATSKNEEPDYFFKLKKSVDATKLTKLYSQILHFYAISKLPEIFSFSGPSWGSFTLLM